MEILNNYTPSGCFERARAYIIHGFGGGYGKRVCGLLQPNATSILSPKVIITTVYHVYYCLSGNSSSTTYIGAKKITGKKYVSVAIIFRC